MATSKTPIGFTMPFVKSPLTLGLLGVTYTEIDTAYNNLKALLLTNWGERVNRNYHGCNLIEFIFDQQSDDLQDRIIQRIEEQVAKWLPYIVLNSIDITFGKDASTMFVKIDFSITSDTTKRKILEQVIQAV
jgi:phage baseplate assembly protein W